MDASGRAAYLSSMTSRSNEARLPPGLDRRGFLRASAGGVVAVGFAALLPAGCSPGAVDAQQAAGLRTLSSGEFATARAAAEAMLAGLPIEPERIALRMDHELTLIGGPLARDMKRVLRLLERLTPLAGRLRPFSELEPAARLRYLAGWRDSRFALRRAAFNAVRSFVYFFAYADPATWSLTGFPGPWPERFDMPVQPVDFGPVV